jgi:hypothetical protein
VPDSPGRQVLSSSQPLSNQAHRLTPEVDRFLASIRACDREKIPRR